MGCVTQADRLLLFFIMKWACLWFYGHGRVWERHTSTLLLKEHAGEIPLLWAASLSFTPLAEIFLPYSTEEELLWGWNKLKMNSDSVPYMGNFSPLVPLCASLCIFLPWLRGLSVFTNRQPPTCHDPVPKITFWFVLEPRMVVFGGWVPREAHQSLRFTVVITEPDPQGWECW